MSRALFCLLACALLGGCGERASPEAAGPASLDEAVAGVDTARFDVLDAPPPPLAADSSAPGAPAPEAAAPSAPEAPAPKGREPLAAPADGRFALLVGISDYPGSRDDLPSGGADVEAMRALLVERYGYRPEHVLTLTDARASRGAIRRAIRAHLGQARTSALLYFSGHGVRLDANPGRADAEPDGRDEAVYVWADDGRSGSLVLDDEIGAWTDALGAEHVLVVLDACHSGTGARGENAGAPPVKEVDLKDVAATLDPAAPWRASEASGGGSRTVLLAAAREREQAYAGPRGEPSLFTGVLARVLVSAPPETPLADAMRAVRTHVQAASRAYGQEHTPQLENGRGLSLADVLARGP